MQEKSNKSGAPAHEESSSAHIGDAKPSERPRYRLDDLLAGMTADNLHVDRAWEQAPPVGREFPNQEK